MIDVVLILGLVAFSYFGWKKGFVKTLLGFASTIISLVFSIVLYNPIAQLISKSFIGDFVRENAYDFLSKSLQNGEQLLKTDIKVETASMLVINTISFVVVIILTKILVGVLTKVLDLAAKFPVIKQANKILGAAVGLISGLLTCYIIIGVLKNLSANDTVSQIVEGIENSAIAVKFYDSNFVSDILSKYL